MADPEMSRPEVKKEPNAEEPQEQFVVTQVNMVCIGLKSGEEAVTLKIQKQDEEAVHYRIGKNVNLEVMMKDYYDRKALGWDTLRFLGPEGNLLNGSQTPTSLDLEDGDIIDAMFHQLGG